jgi:hypothetical protein
MLKRILLGILLSIGISACQSEKEKAYDDLMNDLEDLEDMNGDVYLTDYQVCVRLFTYFAPIAAQCEGLPADTDPEGLAIGICIEMNCDGVAENWEETLVDDCIKYYAVCGDPSGDPPSYSCEYSMLETCDEPPVDTDTEIGVDTATE